MAGNFVVYKPSQPKVRDITAKILLKDPLVERHVPQLGRTTVTIQQRGVHRRRAHVVARRGGRLQRSAP